jgi:uncharacterized protein (TIGR02001 family)
MKKTFSTRLAVLLVSTLPGIATASNWDVGGEISLTSDYYSRGFSENDANPAIQAGLSVTHQSGFYFSLWGSPVSDNNYNGASLELDAAIGWSGSPREHLEITLEALHVHYPGTSDTNDYFDEFLVGLDYDFGGPSAGVALAYSTNMAGNGDAYYWDFNLGIPLGPVDLGLHYGLNRFDDAAEDDYDDWAVGVSKAVAGITVDLSYMGSEGVAGPCGWVDCKDRAVLTLTKEF